MWGIKDGRDAAKNIHKYLENNEKSKNLQNEPKTQRAINES